MGANTDNGGGVFCAEQQADIIQMMSSNDFGMLTFIWENGS